MTELSKQQKADYLTKKLSSKVWRLNNLYWIKDAQGNKLKFQLNWAQRDLFNNLHYFNVILKARQLGMTTFVMLHFLDDCLFGENISAGVIAHTRDDAEDLFRNKIKYAYDNLDDWIKTVCPATQDSARKLHFANGSSITVGTSLRSGTYQRLLVSEYGKIAARYPEKAKEIKTGALNTVHLGQQIFVESTAEGNQGEFFELCETAKRLQQEGAELTRLDPKLHFYPWFKHPSYTLSEKEIKATSINLPLQEYFKLLPDLTPGQKAWYAKKMQQQGDEIKREFPSTPEESFEQSMEGAYFTQQMASVRKNSQITNVPHEPSKPVSTWWDLGMNDMMTIWFFQHIGNEYRFINYYENHGEGLQHYIQYLNTLGYTYDVHNWPHDGSVRDLSTGKARIDTARNLGLHNIKIHPATKSVNDDIQLLRNVLPRCWFDKTNCDIGIRHIDNYRKEWDDRLGVWKDKPRHDAASHGVDPLRNFARHYKQRQAEFIDYSQRTDIAEDYDPLAV